MSVSEPIQNILSEMKQTLKDLKVQVGRELPHFAKLEGNITALEQPRSHFEVDTNAPLPEPFTPEPTLISGGGKLPPQVRSQTIVLNPGVSGTQQRKVGE